MLRSPSDILGERPASRWTSSITFAKTHKAEIAVVLVGVLLRLSMRFTYDVGWGYDWSAHIQTIEWWAQHDSIPRFDYNNTCYHPPLFYWLASRFLRAGASRQSLGLISIIAGCLRLGVMWFGLELYLPRSRFARLVALGVAAIFPADIHLDGMVTNEGLSTLFSTIAIVLAPRVLTNQGSTRRRHAFAAGLGVAVGLALLSKYSVAAIITAVGVAAAVGVGRAIVRGERNPRVLLARVTPLLTAGVIAGAIGGWVFVRNERLYGMVAPTGYDGASRVVVADALAKPFLDRRPIGYVVGFDAEIFVDPYYPKGSVPVARFWSQVVASTFSDYFSNGFALPPSPRADGPLLVRNGRRLSEPSFVASCASTVAGAAIAVVVIIAWLIVFRLAWRRGNIAWLALLLVPALAVFGQLTFSIRFPNDTWGPVKGVYMQFGSAPLFGLFGLAIAETWQRVRLRPVAVIGLLGVVVVAAYTFQTRIPPIPDGVAYWWATRTPHT